MDVAAEEPPQKPVVHEPSPHPVPFTHRSLKNFGTSSNPIDVDNPYSVFDAIGPRVHVRIFLFHRLFMLNIVRLLC